jgi:hypothetical protein
VLPTILGRVCGDLRSAGAVVSVGSCHTSAASHHNGFAESRAAWERTVKVLCFVVAFSATVTLAHTKEMVEMISKYRQEHGLSAVQIDSRPTAIAE